jgi:hypothetical protein
MEDTSSDNFSIDVNVFVAVGAFLDRYLTADDVSVLWQYYVFKV